MVPPGKANALMPPLPGTLLEFELDAEVGMRARRNLGKPA